MPCAVHEVAAVFQSKTDVLADATGFLSACRTLTMPDEMQHLPQHQQQEQQKQQLP
jgi:hypothetical protein